MRTSIRSGLLFDAKELLTFDFINALIANLWVARFERTPLDTLSKCPDRLDGV